ncbi:hypothetical protein CR513_22734, partial [Mucuna pruriens]
MGSRHLRPIPDNARVDKVLYCGCGLFHKIDRSKVSRYYLSRKASDGNSLRQQDLVCLSINGRGNIARIAKKVGRSQGDMGRITPPSVMPYHSTPHSTTQETPSRLMFNIEERVIPSNSFIPKHPKRKRNVSKSRPTTGGTRGSPYAAKARAGRQYGKGVFTRQFKSQDLVLRKFYRNTNVNQGSKDDPKNRL